MKKILFIGAGTMGKEMIKNLSRLKNYKVEVYNRTYQNCINLEKYGVILIKTFPSQCSYDYVFSMVSDVKASEEIFFTKYRLIEKLSKNTTVIECSTLSYKYVCKFSTEASKRSIKFIDIPVSGSKPQAKSAKLRFYYSGKKGSDLTLRNILHSMGSEIIYLNEIGKGTIVKLCINLMVASQWTGCAEAILLANIYGITERDFMTKLIHSQSITSIISTKLSKLYIEESKETHAKLCLLHKDLKYVQLLKKQYNLKLNIVDQVEKIYNRANKIGYKNHDYAYLIATLQQKNVKQYSSINAKELFELCNMFILSAQWLSYVEALKICNAYDIDKRLFEKIVITGMVSSQFMNKIIIKHNFMNNDFNDIDIKLNQLYTLSKISNFEFYLLKIISKLFKSIDNRYSKNDLYNLQKYYSL